MQRRAQTTEKRLMNKYSMGIGGHLRQTDITGKNVIEWARREFDEEIKYAGEISFNFFLISYRARAQTRALGHVFERDGKLIGKKLYSSS